MEMDTPDSCSKNDSPPLSTQPLNLNLGWAQALIPSLTKPRAHGTQPSSMEGFAGLKAQAHILESPSPGFEPRLVSICTTYEEVQNFWY
uniref:Uncharacterized protein n=1 Tax=Moniliophthora roreri TaxID=221103 RepID=A0A0W0GDY2_MONRR